MKKKGLHILLILLVIALFSVPVWARAGGGGGSGGGSGGGGHSSGSSYSGSSSGRGNLVGMGIQIFFFSIAAGGGSVFLILKARRARAKSRRAMAVYAQLGDNWDYREIQRQVEEAYFQVQECWRRMDIGYGAPYMARELQEEFDSKLQWMKVRGEEVVQRNVRLLSALPVYVEDQPGEDMDIIWYLIHGKMTGFYIDGKSKKAVRGNTKPEAFFEYWKFVYRNERWVLQEIRQKDEMDLDALTSAQQ